MLMPASGFSAVAAVVFVRNVATLGGSRGDAGSSQFLQMRRYEVDLWGALAMSLQRHEQAFGIVETDVNKRVIPPDGR